MLFKTYTGKSFNKFHQGPSRQSSIRGKNENTWNIGISAKALSIFYQASNDQIHCGCSIHISFVTETKDSSKTIIAVQGIT